MENNLRIFFTRINQDAIVPRYARYGDAACDLFAIEDVTIKPGKRALVGTGIKVAIPEGFEGQIRPRSGNAWKKGLTVINSPGTIDSGYRGEIKVALINLGDEDVFVSKGDAVAQMKFAAVFTGHFLETKYLDETERGEGGFGHSDEK